MALPKKEAKTYLEIQPRGEGFVIVADKQDASALAALFLQYGISCEWRRNGQPDEEELRFLTGTNQAEVQQILDGYISAKGS
jgi:hypothetical protein